MHNGTCGTKRALEQRSACFRGRIGLSSNGQPSARLKPITIYRSSQGLHLSRSMPMVLSVETPLQLVLRQGNTTRLSCTELHPLSIPPFI
jgi:hypothetical protein